MVKKLTAVLLTMCMAVSLLPMFAQAASKPDIKGAIMSKWEHIITPRFFGAV